MNEQSAACTDKIWLLAGSLLQLSCRVVQVSPFDADGCNNRSDQQTPDINYPIDVLVIAEGNTSM